MIRRKLYTKPFMIAEQFMVDHFCDVCTPKYVDIFQGIIGDPQPVPPSTHFHKDLNGNHILDQPELEQSFSTTNAAAFDHTQIGRSAFMCWKVGTLETYWAVQAQNEHQLALYEYSEVKVDTRKLHS